MIRGLSSFWTMLGVGLSFMGSGGWLHLFPFLRELKNRRRPQTSKKAATTPATVRATAALSMSTIAEAEFALSTPFRQPGIGLQSHMSANGTEHDGIGVARGRIRANGYGKPVLTELQNLRQRTGEGVRDISGRHGQCAVE